MAKVKPVQSYRFDINTEKDEMLQFLDENGYAVIKEVANAEDREKGISFLWDFIHEFPDSTVQRGMPETWNNDEWLASTKNGIMNAFGMGQSNFLWHTRMLPGVKKTFAAIWNTSHLLTSFDGCNLFRPYKYTDRNGIQVDQPEWITRGGWWHTDQNGYFKAGQGKVCVQGLVSYYAANEHTGGLCVLAGSHKVHEEYIGRNELAYLEGDYVKVSDADPVFTATIPSADSPDSGTSSMKHAYEARLVCCQEGDLIVWDSRIVVSK